MGRLSRRSALKHVAPITIAGRAAEIAIAPISASTVRITVQPVVGVVSQSGG